MSCHLSDKTSDGQRSPPNRLNATIVRHSQFGQAVSTAAAISRVMKNSRLEFDCGPPLRCENGFDVISSWRTADSKNEVDPDFRAR